eukprot:TRINITY_DN59499_c0_g1_i1.p1 TRINITY_DN59499_c0_g1~~TRINITY_DN59499_c0_g1_i1.p1  ORF type:complete len:336 (+),score=20.18 TRINITY_DN59499_c0_g1_i1:2-1009(+)
MDSQRLARLEFMVADLHWMLIGRHRVDPDGIGVWIATHKGESRHDVQDLLRTDVVSKAPLHTSETPSRSRRRRLRASKTKRLLWEGVHSAAEPDVSSDEVKKPAKSRRRTGDQITGEMIHKTQPATSASVEGPSGLFETLLQTVQDESFVADMTAILMAAPVSSSTQTCCKCRSILVAWGAGHQCVCDQVFCGFCYRCADSCMCSEPALRHRMCSTCGLKSVVTQDNAGSDAQLCPQCEEGAYEIGFNDIGTLDICHVCGKLDAQSDIHPCDGDPCAAAGIEEQAMAHTRCMQKVTHHRYDSEVAYLCPACVAAGVAPFDPGPDTEGSASSESAD